MPEQLPDGMLSACQMRAALGAHSSLAAAMTR
jgi:hypothetical protein